MATENTKKQNWLENRQYQTILRLTHTIAFEFNLETKEHFVSPFISETLVGNYDDRQLSQIMIEDKVLHPDDFPKMIEFRDLILAGKCGNETIMMRLKTKTGDFRWYRMSICLTTEGVKSGMIVVGTFSDIDEEMRMREKQQWSAQYDETTGIYNKAAFYMETQRLLSVNPDKKYSLFLFDINRFKMVNDLFGLAAGDKLLRFLGKTTSELVLANETYGRIRDDVFCLCIHRSDAEIIQLIENLRLALSDYPLSFSLTLSIGIYHIEGLDMPVSIMVDRASLALRTVKGRAVESFAFYRSEMSSILAHEQKILGEMREGIRTGQFQVYYQPKHNIADEKVIGAEALVRWIHPERGIVSPDDFIGLFERNGLITELDEYVWKSVCEELRGWLDKGYEPLPVSVNVSRIHLYDPSLCEKFVNLTDQYNILHSMLEIELTESAYVENPNLGQIMKALRRQGFTFLMDDFGSGYSSLNMLRNIPVDILKMDLHFLNFTEEESAGKIIMESVIQMAHRLKIFVIAEGVETEAQALFLKEAGCTMAQGFLYSKPMPAREYESKYLRTKDND